MKNYKYIGLFLLSLGIISCDINNELEAIPEVVVPEVALEASGLDFSNYVAVGASFTAGFTDNALFKAAQENSFPNILASKFAMSGGGDFGQPLMNDNIGGLLFGGQPDPNGRFGPRLYFNGSAPATLAATPTTEATMSYSGAVNNFGIPGAKSFHFLAPGYGSLQGLAMATANPYYVRFSSSQTSTTLRPIDDIIAKGATFFTLSEIGGNDVLGYALTGGDGSNPITPSATFDAAFGALVAGLTANPSAKGVVANVPYITSLAHFTTIPYNPIPMDAATAGQLNAGILGPIKQILTALGAGDRISLLAEGSSNPMLIADESLPDLTAQLTGALMQAGVPAAQAGLMGALYGRARHATADDLFVLPFSGLIGTSQAGVPAPFNTIGVTYPVQDKWTVTASEQAEIKTATDNYNATIEAAANANPNLALVDFKSILIEASTGGYMFDDYTMTTNLVTGGLISLDGVHLTARGYALMANEMLKVIDRDFGSNFTEATNGLAKAGNYPTNYSPMLR